MRIRHFIIEAILYLFTLGTGIYVGITYVSTEYPRMDEVKNYTIEVSSTDDKGTEFVTEYLVSEWSDGSITGSPVNPFE